MPRRLIMLGVLAVLSALSTGCCGRIRQCIANRWHYYHGGGACCAPAACCSPSFKVPAPVGYAPAPGCSSCAGPVAGPVSFAPPPVEYIGTVPGAGPVPVLTQPRPIPSGPSVETVPGPMPSKP